MHSFLIIHSTEQLRYEAARRLSAERAGGKPADGHFLGAIPGTEPSAITIRQAREMEKWLALKSSQAKTVFILEAQNLSLPAQHAILKTLEEPGTPEEENTTIILTAADRQSLLPTILSRCKIIRLPPAEIAGGPETDYGGGFSLFPVRGAPAEKIRWLYHNISAHRGQTVSPFRGFIRREEAIGFLRLLTEKLHRGLQSAPNPRLKAKWLILAATAHQQLKSNVGPALVLQQFVLDL